MSWGVDVFLELRQQGEIKLTERGALPLPEEVAAAMSMQGMAEPAEAMRAGTSAARTAFRDALLAVVAVKRGQAPVDGWLRHLPADVLEPYSTSVPPEVSGDHARRWAEFLETREHFDPELRR